MGYLSLKGAERRKTTGKPVMKKKTAAATTRIRKPLDAKLQELERTSKNDLAQLDILTPVDKVAADIKEYNTWVNGIYTAIFESNLQEADKMQLMQKGSNIVLKINKELLGKISYTTQLKLENRGINAYIENPFEMVSAESEKKVEWKFELFKPTWFQEPSSTKVEREFEVPKPKMKQKRMSTARQENIEDRLTALEEAALQTLEQISGQAIQFRNEYSRKVSQMSMEIASLNPEKKTRLNKRLTDIIYIINQASIEKGVGVKIGINPFYVEPESGLSSEEQEKQAKITVLDNEIMKLKDDAMEEVKTVSAKSLDNFIYKYYFMTRKIFTDIGHIYTSTAKMDIKNAVVNSIIDEINEALSNKGFKKQISPMILLEPY